MPTLDELVAACAERRRLAQEAARRTLQADFARKRTEAIERMRATVARYLEPWQIEALHLTWTGSEDPYAPTHVWGELDWHGHIVRIEAHQYGPYGLEVGEHRIAGTGRGPVQLAPANAWEHLLCYLADLPGLHGCGHEAEAGEKRRKECRYCFQQDVPF